MPIGLSETPNEQEGIGRFETTEEEKPERIRRLVKARLTAFENAPGRRFRLRFTLACGPGDLIGADARYEVHLRQCVIDIKTENCNVDLSNAYSFELSPEIIEEIFSGEDSESRATRDDAGGRSEGKLSFVGRFSVSGKGQVSRKKSVNDKQSRKAKGKRSIMLISCNGDYWTVGDHEYGDPRRYNGWLDERYFNEDKDKPLCAVDVTEGAGKATVTVTVCAKYGHLDVFLLDEMGRRTGKAGKQYANDIADALRERVRGMAVAKALSNRQSVHIERLPPAEFELASSTLVAHLLEAITETASGSAADNEPGKALVTRSSEKARP
jgi:hypothetical protein